MVTPQTAFVNVQLHTPGDTQGVPLGNAASCTTPTTAACPGKDINGMPTTAESMGHHRLQLVQERTSMGHQ